MRIHYVAEKGVENSAPLTDLSSNDVMAAVKQITK